MLNNGSSNEVRMALSREERIRRLAEEFYRLRGNQPGSALDDWLLAESEIESQERAIGDALQQSFPVSLLLNIR